MAGLKVAVSGKGGVGKTTLSVLLAQEAARQGQKVLLVDADPDANVAATLGLEREPVPLAQHEELVGLRSGTDGMVNLTPRVDDIPDRFSETKDGVRVVSLGAVRSAGAGCACPESSFLRQLLLHLFLERDELVLVDMEAGIEHLGRGTVRGVHGLLLVVDPDRKSSQTAGRIVRLATELNLTRMWAVANKVSGSQELDRIQHHLPAGLPLLGRLSERRILRDAAPLSLAALPSDARQEVAELFSRLRQKSHTGGPQQAEREGSQY